MSIYKIKKLPNFNNDYTWLVSLWMSFIFLKLFSVFYSFLVNIKCFWNQKEKSRYLNIKLN